MNGNSRVSSSGIIRRIFLRQEVGIFVGLLVLIMLFSITSNTFRTSANILNVIRQIAFNGVLAMGMTMVMVCGDIDLSIGSIYYMAAAFSAYFMTLGVPIWVCVIIGLGLGTLSGYINGVLVAYVGLPAFIATLGMMNVCRGAALILTNGFTIEITSMHVKDPALELFKYIAAGKISGIMPMMVIIFIIMAILSYFIFHTTIFGFRCRAVGGSRGAAEAAGIKTKSVRIIAFTIMGFLAGMAGILGSAFLNNVQANMGNGLELNAIAACIIGGTSISGGTGSIIGAAIGCLILGVLNNGLVLVGVTTYLQVLVTGLVIIGSVSLDLLTKARIK
jgi:ribose transport system permease protein